MVGQIKQIQRKIEDNKYFILAFFLFFILSIISFRKFIFAEGIINYRDIYWPFELRVFQHEYAYLWNPYGSHPTFDNFKRSLIMGPFLFIALKLGITSYTFEKLLFLCIMTITGISMYYTIFSLAKDRCNDLKILFLGSFIAGFIYIFNPFTMQFLVAGTFLWLGYATLPLIFLFYDRSLHTKSNHFRNIIITSFLWAVASAAMVHFIFFVAILLSLWLIFTAIHEKSYQRLYGNIKVSVSVLFIYILFSAYWIVPSLLSFMVKPLMTNYIVTTETLGMFSEPATLINVIRAMGIWWPYVKITIPSFLPDHLGLILTFILPIFAFSTIALYKRNKYVIFFTLLACFSIFMMKGSQEPLSEIYPLLVFKTHFFGWIFRVPQKWGMMLSLAYGVLIGFFVVKLYQIKFTKSSRTINKFIPNLLIVLIVVSSLVTTWPMLTGDYNGTFDPIKQPQEIPSINKWLINRTQDFKVTWLHSSSGAVDVPSISFDNKNSLKHYLNGLLSDNKTKSFGKYLAFSNIRYVLFNDDLKGELSIKDLRSQKDLELVKQEGSIYVFENTDYAQHIFVPSQNFFVIGGLDILTSLNSIEEFNPSNSTLIFLDQGLFEPNLLNYAEVGAGIILNKGLEELALSFIDDKYVIAPFDHTTHHNPRRLWSKAGAMDPLHGEWHPYLEREGIENWDFDYGKGLVFTYTKDSLPMKIDIQKSGIYDLYMRYLQNHKGGKIKILIDEQTSEINTTSQIDDFVWKKVDTINLSEGEHTLTLENVDGFNAVNIFALIPPEKRYEYFDNASRVAKGLRNIYILESESDFYYYNATVSENNPEFSNGKGLILSKSSEMSTKLDIIKNSHYRIAVRALSCPACGDIKVNLGFDNYELNVTSQKEELKLFYTETVFLQNGTYDLTLSSEREATIDVVWIYSVEEDNETLEDVFTPKKAPAEVVSYEEIDPTKYIVHVNATNPFMLAFAESYDPLWVAALDGEKVGAIPLYSVINGFYIDKTGDLTITIEYEPQRWFYYGLVITIIALLFSVGIMIREWKIYH